MKRSPTEFKDLRRGLRVNTVYPVVCDLGCRRFEATIADISWGGLCLESSVEIVPGSLIRLLPCAPGKLSLPVWANSRWCLKQGQTYLSGHQYLSGAAAPSQAWVRQMLRQLGLTERAMTPEGKPDTGIRLELPAYILGEPVIPARLVSLSRKQASLTCTCELTGPAIQLFLPVGKRGVTLTATVREIPSTGQLWYYRASWENNPKQVAAVEFILSTLDIAAIKPEVSATNEGGQL